jgi:hypothetical protein
MKTRVIKKAGKFVPQYKTRWTGWWEYGQPKYPVLTEICDTLEEALNVIKEHEDDGKVVWESEK